MKRAAGTGLLTCALLLGGGGCYKATFISDPQAVRGAEHDEWESFFVFGLVGEQTLDVRQFCPDGKVAQVQTGANFGTGIVTLLTLGIYAPRKVYVTCASGGRASLELSADPKGHIVAAILRDAARERTGVVAEDPAGVRVSFAGVTR